MKKVLYIVFVCFLTCYFSPQISYAQLATIQFEQLDSLQKIDKKPVVVFLHTSWCKYCAMMKKTTLQDKEVLHLLNDKFYFVLFNPEEKRDIVFRNHTFKYQSTGVTTGINELATHLALIDGQLMYPSVCVLNPDYEIIFQHAGFMRKKELLTVLNRVAK